MTEPTYEHLLTLVGELERPESADDRHISWCEPGKHVGVARNPAGLIEIFLVGPRIEARSRVVRENLEHQAWFRQDGEPLPANRLLLPAAGHFEQVAAFLCTELLRSGAATDPGAAFHRTEPVIELAIERMRIADRTILGLCGELVLLLELARTAPDERVGAVIDSWKGHRDTPRDLQLGWVGVEVKTTTRSTSSHLLQGVHQVEPGHGVDEAEETSFLLVSLGLAWVDVGDDSNTVSLPQVVDGLIARIGDAMGTGGTPIVQALIEHIAAYGTETELGYDHLTMANSLAFNRRFHLTFARSYDMSDPAVLVLRTDDLLSRPFIDPRSLRFRLNLPDQVSGDVNPTVGLNACALQILRLAG